ncbi:hypothetical protein [Paenibacillus sp. MMS20-IR301]|uniref:hypothetical protein n=1 Tax=Paenibacillus sp. MMS20-IR301 TaxID=2895946 RepID=UPI0028ECA9E5|nr:hypothetical protein [Paenibacillus sp. MMS20-IR301]WNS43368.1 hypothetical protein LOS79_31270 [Paenibacillus sp. MMS20-IR301]
MDCLYHYYDESTGPFRNLSDLAPAAAESVLSGIREQNKGFASKRSPDYLEIRRGLEERARAMFIAKGGRPLRQQPHYMTFGSCPWLLDWYPDGRVLKIPVTAFSPERISFTYGDLFPTMRYPDGKPYRGQVYTLEEIRGLIREYGLPQHWNATGAFGPERYIEVQVWEEPPAPSKTFYENEAFLSDGGSAR